VSVLLILVGGAGVLILGGRFYAPLIARALGERSDRQTPAVRINDGRDYVPTQTPVVFAHHYASIAGAGPIIGPVLAVYYGWGPALLWILLGSVFLGAVHDYVATHIAVREGGKNLAVITRRYVGPAAFGMMIVLLVALLVLVCAAFLDLSARALTSMVPLSVLQLPADQTLLRVQDGKAIIGGIASTSVIVITACSPLLGFLYLKRKTPVWLCSLLAVVICAISILIGLKFPLPVKPLTWKLLISGYVLISAGLPVWLFLQSRDFINVHILYVGLAFLVVALVAAGLRGGGEAAQAATAIPINNWTEASAHPKFGPGWPVMFVMIACGAVSGFHSLCAGGTTCKQLKTEPATRQVGYFAMLLESFLALCVVCCLIVGLSLIDYKHYRLEQSNPVLTFALSVGRSAHVGLGVPTSVGLVGGMLLLEGFLVTTLDTAIRLTRYMIEDAARQHTAASTSTGDERGALEMTGADGLSIERPDMRDGQPGAVVATHGARHWALRALKYYWVNSGIAVGLMLTLGLGNGYQVVWKIFGSSNQLLAALTLIVATGWLVARRRPVWYTLLPAIFMLVTSVTMMVRLLATEFLPGWPETAPLAITAVVVLLMSAGIVACVACRWARRGAATPAATEG
jgi:carbon starvation protein